MSCSIMSLSGLEPSRCWQSTALAATPCMQPACALPCAILLHELCIAPLRMVRKKSCNGKALSACGLQVVSTLVGCLPLGRALCSSSWFAAAQHAALPLQQLWQQQAITLQHQLAFSSLALGSSTPSSNLPQQVPLQFLQHGHFTTSSHASSSAQQQQQQQEDASKQDANNSSSSGSEKQQHQIPNLQHEAKEASKNLLAGKFDMDELWFAAVGGRLKVWSAKSHPDLKVRDQCRVGPSESNSSAVWLHA